MGKHAGDLYIQCNSGSIISIQTYAICDANYSSNLTSDDAHWSGTNVSLSHSTDGMKLTASNWGDTVCDVTFDSPVSIRWEITTNPTNTFYFSIKESGTSKYAGYGSGGNEFKISNP